VFLRPTPVPCSVATVKSGLRHTPLAFPHSLAPPGGAGGRRASRGCGRHRCASLGRAGRGLHGGDRGRFGLALAGAGGSCGRCYGTNRFTHNALFFRFDGCGLSNLPPPWQGSCHTAQGPLRASKGRKTGREFAHCLLPVATCEPSQPWKPEQVGANA